MTAQETPAPSTPTKNQEAPNIKSYNHSADKPPLFSNTKLRSTVTPQKRERSKPTSEYDSPPVLPKPEKNEIKFELLQRLVNAIDVSDNSPTMKHNRITQRSIYNLDPQSSLALVQMRSEAAASVNVAAAGAITSFSGTPTHQQSAANNGFFHLHRTKSVKKVGKIIDSKANERNQYQQQLTGIIGGKQQQHKSHQSSGIMSPVVAFQQLGGSFSKTIEHHHGSSIAVNKLNNYLDGMISGGRGGARGASTISTGGGILRGGYMAVKLRAGA